MGGPRTRTAQAAATPAKDKPPSPPSSATDPGSPLRDIDTTTLNALQNQDFGNVMDVVDSLRRAGLSSELQLPQLVVAGDQSSGKSSVLEAITEIPFPRKDNLCTRFATQIIMRRSPISSISTKIIPDTQRTIAEQKKLEHFEATIIDFTELPAIIDEATRLMEVGVKPTGSNIIRAFSRDVLSIEITGPKRQQLALVDLPGLIHSGTDEDIQLVHELVHDYIKNPRTIIMAVVSAKSDYATQAILKKVGVVDPNGLRTIGIITKPDDLDPGSENEASWLDLAMNEEHPDNQYYLKLGWHILKNRSSKQKQMSFTERNEAEAAFFAVGRYAELERDIVGIESLIVRLGDILFQHLTAVLPVLQEELKTKLLRVKNDLAKLGDKCESTQDQRRFLTGISTCYQSIVENARNGHYEHDFFGSLDTEAPVTAESNRHRLRAVVQSLNEQFGCLMRRYGRKNSIEYEPASKTRKRDADEALDKDYAPLAKRQKPVTLGEAIDHARQIIVRSKGCELPGMSNPANVSALYRSQSENWHWLASFHVDRVARACESYVQTAVDYTMSKDVANRLFESTIDLALDARLNRAKAELKNLIKDKEGHPITYDPGYIADVLRMRRKREEAQGKVQPTERVVATFNNPVTGQPERYIKVELTDNDESAVLDSSRDKAAEDALDHEQAYYERKVDIFVANVTEQVVERHLLKYLAEETVSPVLVSEMPDKEVAFLTAEPRDTAKKRAHLEHRKTVLESGHKILRSALAKAR
ncbi:hypothetical protein LTS10_000758 [Elasticomyces elasticus]|nr:hypothetical protein LTS10_000758 [Elasticomyces elasticus]